MKTFSEFHSIPTKLDLPKVQLRELTVSPYYTQRGQANPYYELDIKLDVVQQTVGKGEIRFRNVENPSGQELLSIGNGKYFFQIELDGKETPYYVKTTKSAVKSHFGMKQRKNSTASSNVNELLTVYFLLHTNELKMDSKEWELTVTKKSGDTGVLLGDGGKLSYDQLISLLDEDETAERDIKIGMSNAAAVIKDLQGSSIKNVYWTPRGKPGGISKNNPSDVIVETDAGFIGYSNKISAGKDMTPKMNASIVAQFEKLGDSRQVKTIEKFIDDSIDFAISTIKDKTVKKEVVVKFQSALHRDKYTEGGSKKNFHALGMLFTKNNLNFYADDFYYPFRNNLISLVSNHFKTSSNLLYMLNTMGYYTYPDVNATPCPYKLLIGSESSSTIKDVGSNEELKALFLNKDARKLTGIKVDYTQGQQSFRVSFTFNRKSYTLPITLRTRSAGGWAGKALYMSSSGII